MTKMIGVIKESQNFGLFSRSFDDDGELRVIRFQFCEVHGLVRQLPAEVQATLLKLFCID